MQAERVQLRVVIEAEADRKFGPQYEAYRLANELSRRGHHAQVRLVGARRDPPRLRPVA
jgi:hypothetical protein